MAKQKKNRITGILIEQPISNAKKLRTIAENKGFKNRKQFIEFLCDAEVKKFDNKQMKLL